MSSKKQIAGFLIFLVLSTIVYGAGSSPDPIQSSYDDEDVKITVTHPSGEVTIIHIGDGYVNLVIDDNKKVNTGEDPALLAIIQKYNIDHSDVGISKNVIWEHPSVDVIENGVMIESLVVGENRNRVLYSTLQGVDQKIKVAGGLPGSKAVVSFYMIAADGSRIQVYTKGFEFGPDGNAVIEDRFYPLVPDGVYKFLAEVYQGEEKRAYKFWMGERPDEGIVRVMLGPADFVAGAVREIPSSEVLSNLFSAYLKARQEYGINSAEASAAFRVFMTEYFKKLYPNEKDYLRALALLDDPVIAGTMARFEQVFRDERTGLYLDQAIMAAETIKYIYNERKGVYDQGLLQSSWKDMLDPAEIANLAARGNTPINPQYQSMIDFRISQLEEIEGVFLLAKSAEYTEMYKVVSDPSASDMEIASAFGQQSMESVEAERIKRPFTDLVLTRDLLSDINKDNAPGVLYGYGWMFFYSALRVYDGTPSAFSDYPLVLAGGGIANKEDYADIEKAEHDRLSKAQTTSEFTSPEEDMIMVRGLYEAATNTFINLTESYPDSEYAPMANERLDEIKGIIHRQNVARFVKMIVSSIFSVIMGVGFAQIIANVMTRISASLVSAVSSLMKGLFWATAGVQVVTVATQCPKYLFGGEQSRAEQIMSAGEELPNCVAPLLDFLLFTAAPALIDKVGSKGMMGDDAYQSKNFEEKVKGVAGQPEDFVDDAGDFAKAADAAEPDTAGVAGVKDAVDHTRDLLLKSIDDIIKTDSRKLNNFQKYVKLQEIAARGSDAEELVIRSMMEGMGYTEAEARMYLAKDWSSKVNRDPANKPREDWGDVRDEAKQNVWEQSKQKPATDIPNVDNPLPIDRYSQKLIREMDGIGSSSEKLAQLGWKRIMKYDAGKGEMAGQIWLYNPESDVKLLEYSNNGITYKLHVTASSQDYDRIVWEMGNFLDRNRISAKVSPGRLISTPAMGKQYGKVFTVYASTETEMRLVAQEARRLGDLGLKGISLSELKGAGANLRYELPIEKTNNILFYTVEEVNGETLAYPYRLQALIDNRGNGPLDSIAVWP